MKVKTLQYRGLTKLVILCATVFGFSTNSYSQLYKGRDGAESYTTAGSYVLNRYSALGSSVSAGAFSLTVNDMAELNGSLSFAKSVNPYANDGLSNGDLVLIIQMQGADITTTNTSSYGTIVNYNNTGSYELKTVYNVSGNTIYFCDGLTNSYTQSGRSRAQVVRIPRLSTLSVSSGVTITGNSWNGTTGGIVALEMYNNTTLDGIISASEIGFRGGVDVNNVSIASGSANNTVYVSSTSVNNDAAKGESIVGNQTDYESLGGSLGRGAPANGGGGGNGHNAGGGGGSNAGTNGSLTPYNGTGIKNLGSSWTAAWELEYVGFSTDVSVGGGRGGYSFSSSNQDALTYGPGNAIWGGDSRKNIGGFGGRPLDYNGNTRLFLGGGGGAGDGNNMASGNGGNGGGIVFLLSNGNISGSGSISANGQNGYATSGSYIDAGGGAGGGGAIQVLAQGTITGISITATGGVGGNQIYLTGEAEGPGGGGGGGYIATTTTSVARSVAGGNNGLSYSTHVSEFTPNGATRGAGGVTAIKSFADVNACNEVGFILPLNLVSFEATRNGQQINLQWNTDNERNMAGFEIQRSYDGTDFISIGSLASTPNANGIGRYYFTDNKADTRSTRIYYRIKMNEQNGSAQYSPVKMVQNTIGSVMNISVYPNPVNDQISVTRPANWQQSSLQYELFNTSGHVVKSFRGAEGGMTDKLQVGELSRGVYILRISNGVETQNQRIVKL